MSADLKIPDVYGEETDSRLRSYEDARILDLGCGSEPDVAYLTDDSVDVVQADMEPQYLAELREDLAGDDTPQAGQVGADGRSLPFEDDTFDAVYGGASFMHGTSGMINVEASDVFRVLDAGGDIIRAGASHDAYSEEGFLRQSFMAPFADHFDDVRMEGKCFLMEGYDGGVPDIEEMYRVFLDAEEPVDALPVGSVSYATVWPFQETVEVDGYTDSIREQWSRVDALDEDYFEEDLPDEMETWTWATVVSYPDRDVFFLDSQYVDPETERSAGHHRVRGETEESVEELVTVAEEEWRL